MKKLNVEIEFEKVNDIIVSLIDYWDKQDLTSEQAKMLRKTMYWCHGRGILAEAIQQTALHRILSEDEDEHT